MTIDELIFFILFNIGMTGVVSIALNDFWPELPKWAANPMAIVWPIGAVAAFVALLVNILETGFAK